MKSGRVGGGKGKREDSTGRRQETRRGSKEWGEERTKDAVEKVLL